MLLVPYYEDHCDYIKPTWITQDNALFTNSECDGICWIPLPCEVPWTQVPRVRMWTCLEDCTQPTPSSWPTGQSQVQPPSLISWNLSGWMFFNGLTQVLTQCEFLSFQSEFCWSFIDYDEVPYDISGLFAFSGLYYLMFDLIHPHSRVVGIPSHLVLLKMSSAFIFMILVVMSVFNVLGGLHKTIPILNSWYLNDMYSCHGFELMGGAVLFILS